jgi:uncharacterized glyoxalase superfamily protein PhnB
MLNVVVRDLAASLGFYRRLGIAAPAPGDAAGAHVQLRMPGGFSLELDTAESARLWHAGWRADPAGATVVLGFMLPDRQAVDDRYAELTSAGYRGRQPPFDAFWGARWAIVADPDGNDVGLMSPAQDSRRTWPPPAVPRARMLGRVGRHAAGRMPRWIPLLALPGCGPAGKCRATALVRSDHVCENSRVARRPGGDG